MDRRVSPRGRHGSWETCGGGRLLVRPYLFTNWQRERRVVAELGPDLHWGWPIIADLLLQQTGREHTNIGRSPSFVCVRDSSTSEHYRRFALWEIQNDGILFLSRVGVNKITGGRYTSGHVN